MALASFSALAACGEATPWTAIIVAPRRDPPAPIESVGLFQSLETCRAAARSALAERGWTTEGAYHCGLRCSPHQNAFVCESMHR